MSDFESQFENFLESMILGEFISVRDLAARAAGDLGELLCRVPEDGFFGGGWVDPDLALGGVFEREEDATGEGVDLPGVVPFSLNGNPEAVEKAQKALLRIARWGLEYCRLTENDNAVKSDRFVTLFQQMVSSVLALSVSAGGVEKAENVANQLAGVFFYSVSVPVTSAQFRLLVGRVRRVPEVS